MFLSSHKKLQEKITQLGVFSVLGLGLSIPVSTSATTIFTILATVCWLISGKVQETYKIFRSNPVVRAALLLFILFFIGITYSSAGINAAIHGVNTYRKLFLILIFTPFLREKRHQHWAIYAFFIGCFILLGTSCISAWKVFPSYSLPANTLSSRITHSIFMAFFAFWLAVNFKVNCHLIRAAYGILFCLVVYNIFFVVNGRSGYVLFLSLMTFFFYHYFDRKKFMTGILVMGFLLLSTFFFANKFSERLMATKHNISSYRQDGNNKTSIGQRLDFAKTSMALFMKRPFGGYGTGSFKKEYEKMSRQMQTYKTDNPHDEYLSIAVQLGLMGLLMFIYLLAVQWKYAKTLKGQMVLAQGFVLTMAIGSLMNSMLLDSGEGHFFAYFTAVLFANIISQKANSAKIEV